MSDFEITCSDCGGVFVFTEAERQFFASKGLTPPKRCKSCRQARKAAQGGGDQRPRGAGHGGAAPSSRGREGGARPPRWQKEGGGGGWGRASAGFGARPKGGGPHAGHRPRPGRAAEGAPQARPREDERSADRGRRSGRGSAPPRRDEAAKEAKPRAPRPEKPKYDITCATCGAAAQVPFKPLEGREVYCQPCYRARKGLPREAEAVLVDDADAGIVE